MTNRADSHIADIIYRRRADQIPIHIYTAFLSGHIDPRSIRSACPIDDAG